MKKRKIWLFAIIVIDLIVLFYLTPLLGLFYLFFMDYQMDIGGYDR